MAEIRAYNPCLKSTIRGDRASTAALPNIKINKSQTDDKEQNTQDLEQCLGK